MPRHYIAGTLMVNPTSITLAGTPWADPTSTKDRGEGQGNRVSITSRGNLRNHPRWIPTRCNRQGDLGGITLEGFTLEVLHDRVVIRSGYEESPSEVHDRLGTLQRYHQECDMRYHPRHSIVALQSHTTKGVRVMCSVSARQPH